MLIDEDTWNRANGLSRAGYEQQEVTENFPLKRHVRCADCGGYITVYTVKAKGRDKNTDDYRTETENEVFKTSRLFSSSCEEGKAKVTTENLRLSPLVGMRRPLAQNTTYLSTKKENQ